MQHYIRYGLGFKGELLSDTEYDYLRENFTYAGKGNVQLNFKSLTEDYEDKEWGVVVVVDFGDLGDFGKMMTFEELKKACSKEMIIDLPMREKILEKLTEHNFQHYMDKVELIIFTVMY